MFKLSEIARYLKKIQINVDNIAAKEEISRFYLWVDYLYSFVRYGCLINQYNKGHFYKIPSYMRNRVFTQRKLEQVICKYNSHEGIHVLQNKNEFNEYFSKYVTRRWLYARDMTFENFYALYSRMTRLFVKPLDAMEGEGVYVINTDRGGNSDVKKIFDNLHGKKLLIEEAIVQHPKLNLGNASVNSVRLLTALDTNGVAHIIRAGLRAGVGDSVVDNYTAGGVLYEIDPNTGIIDHKGIQGENYNIIYHPGTSICMLGFQLPNWDIAIKAVKESAEKLSTCRFIGWDVAFTEHSVELIEGNHNPGIFTMESLGTPGAYSDTIKLLNL